MFSWDGGRLRVCVWNRLDNQDQEIPSCWVSGTVGPWDRGTAGTLGQPGSSSVSLIALDRLVSKQLRSRLLLFDGLGFISVC